MRKPTVRASDVIDLQRIERMAANGMTMEQIAGALGISDRTLYRAGKASSELAETIKRGRLLGIERVTEKLQDLISEDNQAAVFFFLKCKAGWNENQIYIDKLQAEIDELRAMLTPVK